MAAPDPGGRSDRVVADLPGWDKDDHDTALAVYLASVDLLSRDWPRSAHVGARLFFETRFQAVPLAEPALLTGYYEPELVGATQPDAQFCHPLFATPPSLTNATPWFTRAEIEAGNLLAGHEIVWLDSALEAFLAQVQGSVRVRLIGGGVLRLGFAAKNGQPYVSIAKELIRQGTMNEADASVAAIRDWAARHPDQVAGLLRMNPSFVFFRPIDLPADQGPLGTMQRPVTALRTIAVDPDHVPLGAPIWVEWQGQAGLMIAQDTGSAIKGPQRGDIFFGSGAGAGAHAGALKTLGRMTVLMPKDSRQ